MAKQHLYLQLTDFETTAVTGPDETFEDSVSKNGRGLNPQPLAYKTDTLALSHHFTK